MLGSFELFSLIVGLFVLIVCLELYTYRYKSLELERQLRTHCHTFHQSLNEDRQARRGGVGGSLLPNNGMFSVMAAFQDTSSSFVGVFTNSLVCYSTLFSYFAFNSNFCF